MRLSVIVTSFGSSEGLRSCLESLARQETAAEIVVVDCSPANPGAELGALFPGMRFLHFPSKRRVPELRWSALPLTTGEIVAAVEARCVPDQNWCLVLSTAHELYPDAPAIGGPVRLAAGARARDVALYLCEYGHYAPPVEPGPSPDISGANLSYKRAALDAEKDIIEAGSWETLLHKRWRAMGRKLVLSEAAVEFRNAMTWTDALRQRFAYGRGYAADRVERRAAAVRIAYALATPLLPVLLLFRIVRDAAKRNTLAVFAGAALWCTLFTICWSVGEAAGYLLGRSSEPEIY